MAGSHEVRGSNPLFSTMNPIAGRAIDQRFFYVQVEGSESREGERLCGLLGEKERSQSQIVARQEFRVIPLENAGREGGRKTASLRPGDFLFEVVRLDGLPSLEGLFPGISRFSCQNPSFGVYFAGYLVFCAA